MKIAKNSKKFGKTKSQMRKNLETSKTNLENLVETSLENQSENQSEIKKENATKSQLKTLKKVQKTVHLLGIFNNSNLKVWANLITKYGKLDYKIVLDLVAKNNCANETQTEMQNEIQTEIQKEVKLQKIWDDFVKNFGEIKKFEQNIYLHSLCGWNYLKSQEIMDLAHYFYTIFDYQFIDKFDGGCNNPLTNYFYEKHKTPDKHRVLLPKYLKQLDEKWLYRTPNLPPETEDPNFFSYRTTEHFLFMFLDKTDKEKRLKLGRLKFDISKMLEAYSNMWGRKNIEEQDWLPCNYYYIPKDEGGENYKLPRIGINKKDTICLINLDQNWEKFKEILADLNAEFELNLKIIKS